MHHALKISADIHEIGAGQISGIAWSSNAFLMKPLDLPKLLQTVRRVLDEDKE